MAQVDPNIAMGFRPVQIPLEESPLNRMQKYVDYENALAKSQELQRGIQQRNALSRIRASGLDIESPEYLTRVSQEVPDLLDIETDRQLKRQQLREAKQTADLKQSQLTREQIKEAKKSLLALPNLETAVKDIYEGVQSGLLTAEQGEALRAGLPMNEEEFPDWQKQQLLGYLTVEKQLERQDKLDSTAYADYVMGKVINDPDAKLLSKAEFIASRNEAPTPAAAPAVTPAVAPASADATVTTPPEAGTTVSAEGVLLAPGVAELYAADNPKAKAMADILQRRFEDKIKSQRFTGEFANVDIAEDRIAELKKRPQTPEVVAKIATLQDMVNTAKQGKAPKVDVRVGLSTEKKYGEKFAGGIADKDVALMEAAERAPEAANTANRILGLLQSGQVITGSAANIKLQMAKFLRLGGGSDSEAITNTEVLISSLADSTLGAIKSSGLGSGQGFTDSDRQFLERAKAGQITYDADSLRYLARLAHKTAAATADKWNSRSKAIPKSAIEGTGISTESVTVPPILKTGPRDRTPAKNSKGWTLHTDKDGNRAYVSPDGKQFEEVK